MSSHTQRPEHVSKLFIFKFQTYGGVTRSKFAPRKTESRLVKHTKVHNRERKPYRTTIVEISSA